MIKTLKSDVFTRICTQLTFDLILGLWGISRLGIHPCSGWPTNNSLQEREGSNIKFIQGIPDNEDEIVTDPIATHLVIFDDMLGDKVEEKIK